MHADDTDLTDDIRFYLFDNNYYNFQVLSRSKHFQYIPVFLIKKKQKKSHIMKRFSVCFGSTIEVENELNQRIF